MSEDVASPLDLVQGQNMAIEGRLRSSEPKIMHLREYGALLARYLRAQLGLVIALAAILSIQIGLQLVNPQIMRRFIDDAQAGSPIAASVRIAVVFLLVALLIRIVSVLASYVGQRIGWTATNQLRADLTRHCLGLDMSFHNQHTPGEMIERIDGDASALGGFFSTFVITVVGNIVMLVGIMALLIPRGLASRPGNGGDRGRLACGDVPTSQPDCGPSQGKQRGQHRDVRVPGGGPLRH